MENFISPLRFKKSNYIIRLFSNNAKHTLLVPTGFCSHTNKCRAITHTFPHEQRPGKSRHHKPEALSSQTEYASTWRDLWVQHSPTRSRLAISRIRPYADLPPPRKVPFKETRPDTRPISSRWRVGRDSNVGGQGQYPGGLGL